MRHKNSVTENRSTTKRESKKNKVAYWIDTYQSTKLIHTISSNSLLVVESARDLLRRSVFFGPEVKKKICWKMSTDANRQIKQMVNFIMQEAHEKVNEIRIKVRENGVFVIKQNKTFLKILFSSLFYIVDGS